MHPKSVLLTAALATVASAWEEGVDCTSDVVATDGQADLFFAIDSNGEEVSCDEIDDVSTDGWGATCYRSTESDGDLGDIVKCPQDPAPSKNPDGSDAEEVADGIIKSYCQNAGGPPFVNTIGCLMYGYYEANGDPIKEQESGAMAVCNTIFSGACTFFTSVAPEIAEGMDRACIDDPNSNACDFANPGK
jgi:hypothetical protein